MKIMIHFLKFTKSVTFTLSLLFLFFPTFLWGQYDFSKEAVKERLSKDMLVLTSDSLQGRESGTIYEIKARDYIAAQFHDIGLKPVVGDTSFNQRFLTIENEKSYYNVCGFLDNKAAKTIVIGAHYDHIGMGNFGSRFGPGQIHSGADDNASGVVAMLEMARYLSTQKQETYNYMFVAFTAEEIGLFGSEYFVNSSISKKLNINYMINFDMVGRFNFDHKKRIIMFGTGSSPQWKKVFKNFKPENFKLKKIKYGPPFSDHASFYIKGIPVLYFTTGTPDEYHTPSDIYKIINFDGMADFLEYVKKITLKMEKYDNIKFRESGNCEIFKAYIFIFPEMFK